MNAYDWAQVVFGGVKVIGEIVMGGIATAKGDDEAAEAHEARAALEVNGTLEHLRGVRARRTADDIPVLTQARAEDAGK